jgi:hypothetical protein
VGLRGQIAGLPRLGLHATMPIAGGYDPDAHNSVQTGIVRRSRTASPWKPKPTQPNRWPRPGQLPGTAATTDLDETQIQGVLQKVCQQAGWAYAETWRPNPDGTCQLLPAWHGGAGLDAFRRPTEALHFMPRVGLPSRVQRSKQTVFVAEVTSDPWFCRRTAARKAGLVGGLAVPVRAGDSVAAVLVFFGRSVQVPAWPMLAEAAQLAASRLGGPRP